MIPRVRVGGICQRCRHDFSTIFSKGQCNPIERSIRPTYIQRNSLSRTNTRSLSDTRRVRTSHAQENVSELSTVYKDGALDEAAILASQIEATEALERDLSESTESNLEQRIRSEAHILPEADLNVAESETPEDIAVDYFSRLRTAGAPVNDIVRVARQLYGDILPDGLLDDQELVLYKRLYGEPAGETTSVDEEVGTENTNSQTQLFSSDGDQIAYRPSQDSSKGSGEGYNSSFATAAEENAATLVQTRAMDVARSLGGTVVEDEAFDDLEEDEEESESGSDRSHPLTRMGKFGTIPRTIFLPQETFVKPVENIMSEYSNKHLKETSERIFGGQGLPNSPLTPRSGKSKQQVPIPLTTEQNAMSEMDANAFITTVMPPTYASIMSVLVETRKRLGPTWLNELLAKEGGPRVLDAGAGGAGIIAWREIVTAHWNAMHNPGELPSEPPTTKSVVLTGADTLRHRAASMLENTTFIPRLPDYVHTRNAPTLEDNRPAQQRKKFDVIIAPHTLWGFKEEWMRKQHIQNLWSLLSEDRGILILIEKGVPRGFEAIAGARDTLLDRYIAVPHGHSTFYSKHHAELLEDDGIHKKDSAMIVAPCTNHEKCPMYTVPGLAHGRKDFCSFQQRYIRPPFLQRVLGAKDRNHDDVDFSYLSVMKGDDLRTRNITTWESLSDPLSAPFHSNAAEVAKSHQARVQDARNGLGDLVPPDESSDPGLSDSIQPDSLPTFHQMPRSIYPPLKRQGHITLDFCTPAGRIERWTVPRSFSRQAYRDARKARWGDLWALGAKTQVARNLNLGSPEKDMIDRNGQSVKVKGRGRKERLKMKAEQILEKREEERMDDLINQQDTMAALEEGLEMEAGGSRRISGNDTVSATMPLNNRARKALRKAAREQNAPFIYGTENITASPNTSSNDFENQNSWENVMAQHKLADWDAEFQQAANQGKDKKKQGRGRIRPVRRQ